MGQLAMNSGAKIMQSGVQVIPSWSTWLLAICAITIMQASEVSARTPWESQVDESSMHEEVLSNHGLFLDRPSLGESENGVQPSAGPGASGLTPGKRKVAVNKAAFGRGPGAEIDFTDVTGRPWSLVVESRTARANGIVSITGYLKGYGPPFSVLLTSGPEATYGHFITPLGELELTSDDGAQWLIDRIEAGHTSVPLADDTLEYSGIFEFQASEFAERIIESGLGQSSEWDSFSQAHPLPYDETTALQNVVTPAPDTVIDLLVYVSELMVVKHGNAVQTRVHHLVDWANQAFMNSQTGVALRVVEIVELRNSSSVNFDNLGCDPALNAISTSSTIASRRNAVGADLVTLIRPYQKKYHDCGGIAWLSRTPNPSLGFSVNQEGQDLAGSGWVAPIRVLAHEVGHNLGSAHDRKHSSSPGATTYSYGLHSTDKTWGTIMSYVGGQTIATFSNPDMDICLGDPCGIAGYADNARSIRGYKGGVASYRATKVLPAPPMPYASQGSYTDRILVNWPAVPGATRYRGRIQDDYSGGGLSMGYIGRNEYSYTHVRPNVKYFFYFQACLDDSDDYCSPESTPATGWVTDRDGAPYPAMPLSVAASDGTFSDRVRVTWASPQAGVRGLGYIFGVQDNPLSSVRPLRMFECAGGIDISCRGATNTVDVASPDSSTRQFCVRAIYHADTWPEGEVGPYYSRWQCDSGHRTQAISAPDFFGDFFASQGDAPEDAWSDDRSSFVKLTWSPVRGAHHYEIRGATTLAGLDASEAIIRPPPEEWIGSETWAPFLTYYHLVGGRHDYWVVWMPGYEYGRPYYFRIDANNDFGRSKSAAQIGYGAIPAPVASGSNDQFSNRIRVSWEADPKKYNDEFYRVLRADELNPSYDFASVVAELNATAFSWDDTSASPNQIFRYWVERCRSSTMICSEPSGTYGSHWSYSRAFDLVVSLLPVGEAPSDVRYDRLRSTGLVLRSHRIQVTNTGPDVSAGSTVDVTLQCGGGTCFFPRLTGDFLASTASTVPGGRCSVIDRNPIGLGVVVRCVLPPLQPGETVIVTAITGTDGSVPYQISALASIPPGVGGAFDLASGNNYASQSSEPAYRIASFPGQPTLDNVVLLRPDRHVVEGREKSGGAIVSEFAVMSFADPIAVSVAELPTGNTVVAIAGLRIADQRGLVEIRNIHGELLRTVWMPLLHRPLFMAVIEDADGDGFPEIAVLCQREFDGRLIAVVFNIASDPTWPLNVRRINFSIGQVAVDFSSVPDSDGDGVPELVVLSRRLEDDRGMTDIRNAFGEPNSRRESLRDGYAPIAVEGLADSDGDGRAELAIAFVRTSDGRPGAEVRNIGTTQGVRKFWFHRDLEPIDFAILHNWDWNTAPTWEIAMLGRMRTTGRASLTAAELVGDFAPVRVNLSPGFQALALTRTSGSAMSYGASVLLRREADGRLVLQTKPAVAGAPTETISFRR